jgi:hypothetical protein
LNTLKDVDKKQMWEMRNPKWIFDSLRREYCDKDNDLQGLKKTPAELISEILCDDGSRGKDSLNLTVDGEEKELFKESAPPAHTKGFGGKGDLKEYLWNLDNDGANETFPFFNGVCHISIAVLELNFILPSMLSSSCSLQHSLKFSLDNFSSWIALPTPKFLVGSVLATCPAHHHRDDLI